MHGAPEAGLLLLLCNRLGGGTDYEAPAVGSIAGPVIYASMQETRCRAATLGRGHPPDPGRRPEFPLIQLWSAHTLPPTYALKTPIQSARQLPPDPTRTRSELRDETLPSRITRSPQAPILGSQRKGMTRPSVPPKPLVLAEPKDGSDLIDRLVRKRGPASLRG